MIVLECSRPFLWRPRYVRAGHLRRAAWAGLVITHYPCGFNSYFDAVAHASVQMHVENEAIRERVRFQRSLH